MVCMYGEETFRGRSMRRILYTDDQLVDKRREDSDSSTYA